MTIFAEVPCRRVTLRWVSALTSSLLPLGGAWATENVATKTQVLEEVSVTASRVTHPGFQAPTPTTVVSAEDLENTGAADIAAYLNNLPAFRPSRTPATTIQSGTAIGVNLIDLRGIGTERTLVLVNSRRHVPTQSTGAVDFNVIPSVALRSVEVITGGASAAWGSDAVAGVVNLLFDDQLQGGRFDAQYGISDEGDGVETRYAAASGSDVLDGGGHFMIAAEYHKNEGVNAQGDRDWGSQQWQRIANPLDTGPNDDQPQFITRSNVNVINATHGGVILGPAAVSGYEFGPGGELVPRQLGSPVSPPFMVGGSGTCLSCKDIALSVPFERNSMLATFDYDLSDGLQFFFEGSYAQSEAGPSVLVAPFSFNIPLLADNAFMPEQLRTMMADNNLPSITIGRTNADFGATRAESSANTRRAVVGFEGKLLQDWSWQVYYQTGETTFRNRQPGNLILANFALATDAVRDPLTNNIVCRAAANAASLPPGLQAAARACVPINLFGFGSPSAAAIDYVTATSSSEHRISQDVIAGEVRGDLWDLWAGPLSVAAGLEYRKEEVDVIADPISQENGFFMTNPKSLRGSFNVREAFLEAALPLLDDKPLARSLGLNAAIRRTDYSTVGLVTTSKVGATWEPHQSLLVRATVSRDIRAPNIQELYLTRLQSFFSGVDPCVAASQASNPTLAANCQAAGLPANFAGSAALVPSVTGGNPNLEEEQADTMTAGVVLSPEFLPGFRASLDWFNIEIDDVITQLTAQGLLTSCYGSPEFPNATCASISRGPTGQLSEIRATFLNAASFKTSGIDAEFQYGFDVGSGAMQLRLIGTYLREKSNSPDGVIEFDRAGEVGVGNIALSGLGGMPRWRWESSVGYATDRFGVDARVHYTGKGKIDVTQTPRDIDHNDIGDEWTVDLSGRYVFDLGEYSAELFGGVNNVFDRDPPLIPLNFLQSYATNPGLYDVMGRYFYAGVRVRL